MLLLLKILVLIVVALAITSSCVASHVYFSVATADCVDFRPSIAHIFYYALVRSHLETAVVAWCPHTDEWVTRIESVQRKFTRFALRFHSWPDQVVTPTYEQRCEALGMETLSKRRQFLRAAFVGKLLLGAIDAPSILARINFNVIPRPLRTWNALRLDFHRTQYGQQEPIRAMCDVLT